MFEIRLYDKGYCLYSGRNSSNIKGGGKRGKLTGQASSASFRRLREFCIKHDCFHLDCWGITLTIPGLEILDVSTFKTMHHKLCVWCNDNNVPLIWRVELQQRGQPHLHCVAYGNSSVAIRICKQWQDLLSKLPSVLSLELVFKDIKDFVMMPRAFVNGSHHAFAIEHLAGDYRAFRYLVSHMAKAKQVQLGFAGRNWGVCNRSLFDSVASDGFEVSPCEYFAIRRWVRRLVLGAPGNRKGRRKNKFLEKRRISRSAPDITFYKARKVRSLNCAFWLGNPVIVRRMMVFAHRAFFDLPF